MARRESRAAAAAHLDRIHDAGGELALVDGRLAWIRKPLGAIELPFGAWAGIAESVRPWLCDLCFGISHTPDARCDGCYDRLWAHAWRRGMAGEAKWHVLTDESNGSRSRCGVALDLFCYSRHIDDLHNAQICRRCVRWARAGSLR